jgi:FdhD protein
MKEPMTRKISVLRVNEQEAKEFEDTVVREHSATIMMNDQEVVTLLCYPMNLEYLTVGFLLSEGLLKSRSDIIRTSVTGDDRKSTVRVETKDSGEVSKYTSSRRLITSSGGRGASSGNALPDNQPKIESRVEISASEILALVEDFHRCSPVFEATGGVHSAALCRPDGILVFHDDIGRHNAVDKVFGECFLKDISTTDGIIVTSGRVSSEILLKVARRRVPVIISVAAPTDMAVQLAEDLGMTLVGFVRGSRMNVYTHDWRVKKDGKQER